MTTKQVNKMGFGSLRVNKVNDDMAEVFVYGDIGGWMDGVDAKEFARELKSLKVTDITARINSGGGSVFEGQAIYNSLVNHPARVNVVIDGIAASIASVIAMAGDNISITEGSHIMVHKPWSIAMGDANSMRKEAEVLDSLESGIIDIYAARTGKSREKLEKWVSEETWFKGAAAVDAGFADNVIPAKRKENFAKSNILNHYLHLPIDIAQDVCNTPHIRDVERVLRDVEGFSQSQAKRIIALMQHGYDYRDGDGQREAALKLAEFLDKITNEVKNGGERSS